MRLIDGKFMATPYYGSRHKVYSALHKQSGIRFSMDGKMNASICIFWTVVKRFAGALANG
ncbi:MAG: hypothetical protein COB54_06845 [Alphaproteobacteria bacterium]|nr:MAG: hypothetical protein COB54_06845 [Alphaproteobacteria bacterium]